MISLEHTHTLKTTNYLIKTNDLHVSFISKVHFFSAVLLAQQL